MFKKISIDEAKNMMDTGHVNIIDIRDLNSYLAAHIQNAEHITSENMGEFCDNTDKLSRVIVYCYHGNNSQMAAAFLAEHGFNEVYSLDGGFEQWRGKYSFESE